MPLISGKNPPLGLPAASTLTGAEFVPMDQTVNSKTTTVHATIKQIATIAGTGALTYATLPASPLAGQRAFITDSPSATFLGVLTVGGGANKVPVVYNGTNWVVG